MREERGIQCDVLKHAQVILAKERLSEDVDLGKIAGRTDGYTGSDLRQVCTNAAMRPVKDLLKLTGREARLQVITSADLLTNIGCTGSRSAAFMS